MRHYEYSEMLEKAKEVKKWMRKELKDAYTRFGGDNWSRIEIQVYQDCEPENESLCHFDLFRGLNGECLDLTPQKIVIDYRVGPNTGRYAGCIADDLQERYPDVVFRLAVDSDYQLTFIMLHEIGHILTEDADVFNLGEAYVKTFDVSNLPWSRFYRTIPQEYLADAYALMRLQEMEDVPHWE